MDLKEMYWAAVDDMHHKYDVWCSCDREFEDACWLEFEAASDRVDELYKELKEDGYGN